MKEKVTQHATTIKSNIDEMRDSRLEALSFFIIEIKLLIYSLQS